MESSEDDIAMLERIASQQKQGEKHKIDLCNKFRENVDFSKGHPSWIKEIEDNLSVPLIQQKLRNIANDLGVLGLLIYLRLFRFNQMTMSDDPSER